MLVARDREPVGLLAVADELRAPSRQVVGDLHELGVQRIVMLTGGHEHVFRTRSPAASASTTSAQGCSLKTRAPP
jgi:cation transport ATPase